MPFLDWLDDLPLKARVKCQVRLRRLQSEGHELRRPESDYLRDGIYELRASLQGVNYRILYFFHGSTAAVVSHGLVKERAVPSGEIEDAIKRRARFVADPKKHTYEEIRW